MGFVKLKCGGKLLRKFILQEGIDRRKIRIV